MLRFRRSIGSRQAGGETRVLDAKGTQETKPENTHFGSEIQAAVKAELNKMISAPFFSQSARCRRFLSHVVLQTLSGKTDQLKERMIGISVFERANDYNTGEDAIVRVTANEVRKRIGQFYQESRTRHPVQIDLPRGTYVPEFRIHLTEQDGESTETGDNDATEQESPAAERPVPSVSAHSGQPEQNAETESRASAGAVASQKVHTRRWWFRVTLALLILGTCATVAEYWRIRTRSTFPDVWETFAESKVPVLMCLGTHNLPYAVSASSGETEDAVMREETIPIDDVSVVSSMARLLGNRGIPFRVAAADRTSLTDLQNQPVILIGAVDNQWAIQLTQSLRYRLSVDFPLGPEKPPIAAITDSEQPGTQWKIDFSIPLSAWKTDYAVVAKYNDATVGVPVLIEAGLGNDGSLAASRFLTSSGLTTALGNEPSCREKVNFEAVIETKIIDTRPGAAHIVRLTCW